MFISEYYKWILKNKLQSTGEIRLYSYSKITAAEKSIFIADNITIEDFSQINLFSQKSFLKTGKNFLLKKFCLFSIWDAKVTVGDNVLFNNYCSLNAGCEINIGDNCWFGEGTRFYDHNHKYKLRNIPIHEQGYTMGPINIGNNCWVGSNCIILQNVTIGENSVIGANNLIYKSVPPNSIVKSKAMELVSPIQFE